MSGIVFGFGPYHDKLTEKHLQLLGEHLALAPKGKEDRAYQKVREEIGRFKDSDYYHLSGYARRIDSLWTICTGSYTHYRDDHPMSPDGWVCLSHHYCVSVYHGYADSENEPHHVVYVAIGKTEVATQPEPTP